MSHVVNHFLLVYDHNKGKLLEVLEFAGDSAAALKRYEDLEAEHRGDPKMDIVLVGSDSLDTIKITHRNYFDEGRTLAAIEEHLRKFSADLNSL